VYNADTQTAEYEPRISFVKKTIRKGGMYEEISLVSGERLNGANYRSGCLRTGSSANHSSHSTCPSHSHYSSGSSYASIPGGSSPRTTATRSYETDR
jgi:hypothetical protein